MFNSIIKTIYESSDVNLNNLYLQLVKYENPSIYENVTSFDKVMNYTDYDDIKKIKSGIEYIKKTKR